jgi:hypothetical protein
MPYLTGKNNGAPNEKRFWRMGLQFGGENPELEADSDRRRSQALRLSADIGEKKDLAEVRHGGSLKPANAGHN